MIHMIWMFVGFVLGLCCAAAPLLADHKACREEDGHEDDFGVGA